MDDYVIVYVAFVVMLAIAIALTKIPSPPSNVPEFLAQLVVAAEHPGTVLRTRVFLPEGVRVKASASIASLLWAPDSSFITSVEVQVMFLANLFALIPVLAGVWHLTRLMHSYERAREARNILKNFVPA